MATSILLLVSTIVLAASASDVPVLMWSPERPLSDLPQAPSADKISQDSFSNNYLKQLLGKEANVIVAFLQDKLHINDFSKYADVYSQQSNGGAFTNVKSLLDEHFSLELPRVLGSRGALDLLRQGFEGRVHDLPTGSAISDVDLSGSGNFLVIVRLSPVAGAKNVHKAIAQNDEVIGQVASDLKKRGVKYTALYTADTSQEREKRDTYQGRHLLVQPEAADTGMFYNVSYTNGTLYAFLTSVSACVMPNYGDGKPPTYCVHNVTISTDQLKTSDMTVQDAGNNTLNVVLKMDNIATNFSVSYNLTLTLAVKNQFDRWEMLEASLSMSNSSGGEMLKNEVMVTRGYDLVFSLLYSFHCTSMEWYNKNNTSPTLAFITLGGFQIQPYGVTGNEFALSQDCVGWFSVAIWMALFPVGIHIIILFFGMYMVASLSTNDRFDDPKGKPLTINAGE